MAELKPVLSVELDETHLRYCLYAIYADGTKMKVFDPEYDAWNKRS